MRIDGIFLPDVPVLSAALSDDLVLVVQRSGLLVQSYQNLTSTYYAIAGEIKIPGINLPTVRIATSQPTDELVLIVENSGLAVKQIGFNAPVMSDGSKIAVPGIGIPSVRFSGTIDGDEYVLAVRANNLCLIPIPSSFSAGALPTAGQTFYASLKTSLVPEVGTGGPTWSRATAAWRFNDIGLLRQIPSGCAEFGWARLVTNTLPNSQDLSGAGWTKDNLTVSGGGATLTCNSSGTVRYRTYPASGIQAVNTGEVWMMYARLTYVNHPFVQFMLTAHTGGWGYANFDLLNGTVTNNGCLTASITPVSAGVYDCFIKTTALGSSSTAKFILAFVSGLSAIENPTFAASGGEAITINRCQLTNVTGRDASYVPEYVSVGSTVGKNFFLHTDDFSQSAWIKSNVTITQSAIANPVNGLVNAQKVEVTTSTDATFYQDATSSGLSSGNVFVVYVKQGSGVTDANSFIVRNNTSATNLLGISFNYSTGAITYNTGSTGASAVALPNGWWKLQMVVTSGISDGNTMRLYIGYTGLSETAGEHLYVYRPYAGQGTTAPDVIPVVAGAWDAHGTGVDGCKYFATDWQGAPIPASNLTRLRKEPAATNVLLWSRDLSNAAWSTKTNITAAQTATGLDGIANTATTLTATAADAIILQPTSGIASAARCASAHVERVSGTGTISFTQDGGSTWTDITSLINSSTWTRVQITSTLANPSVGFKIGTSGDAIDVDVVQNEAGSVATSPIVTTTAAVTRNAESLTYQAAGNIDAALGTLFCEYSVYEETMAAPRAVIGLSTTAATANALLLHATSVATSSLSSGDGTTIFAKTGLGSAVNTKRKAAVSWGTGRSLTAGGLAPQAGAFSGTLPSTAIAPGAYTNGTFPINGYIGQVAIYNYKMTDAELQAITT